MRDLFAEGALSSAFLPTFTARLEEKGKSAAFRLGNLVFTLLLLVTGSITALGFAFSEQIVSVISNDAGGDPTKVALAAQLARRLMPLLSIISLGAVWMGMLNAQKRFAVPALAPALFNVVVIAVGTGLALSNLPPEKAVFYWALGTLSAGLFRLGCSCRRCFAWGTGCGFRSPEPSPTSGLDGSLD